ncbi:type V CRISPR-associated protein Cas4 [Candidatus Saccharibacteria bacterium QS_5_54_17]|nr:MAG: type V CRISPR-associated protein Cas4 [Candidatus Saccharibacteria bacterium QS_5_54_17]
MGYIVNQKICITSTMEQYIQISTINDFLFSPRSLYLHSVYASFNTKTYHASSQIAGDINHSTLENANYSSSTRYLQGVPVYSEHYGIMGKIDIYDRHTKSLIERKTKIKTIHTGYKYQLYAQYFGLTEAGYEVERLLLHSLDDNRRYEVPLPDQAEVSAFEQTLRAIWEYDIAEHDPAHSDDRCEMSIYKDLSY